jgi:DnaK suppressor protein
VNPREILLQRLVAADERAAVAGHDLEDVRLARSDASADDEHDPEGSTLSEDWSRLDGLARAADSQRTAILAALQRIEDGTYGICISCGRPIGAERLEARPEAATCIECARQLER